MEKITKTFVYFRDFIRGLLVILIFSTISNFWYLNQLRDYAQQYITHATELRVSMHEIVKYSDDIITATKENVFDDLKNALVVANNEFAVLTNGKSVGGQTLLPPSPEKIKAQELDRFSKIWELMQKNVAVVLENKNIILSLNKTDEKVSVNIKKAEQDYWSILKALEVKKDNDKTTLVTEQIEAIETILINLQKMLNIAQNTPDRKDLMEKVNVFHNRAVQLQTSNIDPSLTPKFDDISKLIQTIVEDMDSMLMVSESINKVHTAVSGILSTGPLAFSLSKILEEAYVAYPRTNTTADFSAYILGLLSFLVLIVSIYLFQKEGQFHIKMAEDINKAMQTAVEKLLKELPEVASGNVVVEPPLLENASLSKRIPESFNYALNALRKLVQNIGKTAKNVSAAATDAQKITKELATSSGQQAQEIVEVTASVSSMAASIEQVSANASESASVALESVNIASEGGKEVRSTISGMERIQTQIQETSNYMRRLSDSSQEIGEIVSLIDGIADQTNILSLNASIQAAMAGDAGRGFAVVADEVQRLAEKVSYATKEIGSLVRSIQTDTNQVIVAMEQTKAQVLEGVNSAQHAGSTLEKIETVSRRLSDLIQNISSSASAQASQSGKISNIMNDVKEIAKQTASGTMTTVDLIGNLMQFVTDLRNSVFEFKLLEDAKKWSPNEHSL